jgi:hypothetical protein
MQFVRNTFILALLSVLVCMASCRKKDTVAPFVVIEVPLEGTYYDVFDTISVVITASDESDLQSVSAKIVDSNFIPIGQSYPINVNANTGVGGAELILSDKLLPTADYYVLVIASDGANQSREFRKIRINAIPKKRRAIYFADSDNAQGSIWKLDSLFQSAGLWVNPGQDILKLCVNSLTDKLTMIGEFSIGMVNYRLQDASVNWMDQVFSAAQTQRYNDLACYQNAIYTSIFDKEFRAYNHAGGLIWNAPTGNHRPGLIYVSADYTVVEMDLTGTQENSIFVYNTATQALLWQLVLPFDVIAICPYRNDEVFIFGNEGDQARVFHYDIGDNAYWEPRQLPFGRIADAVKMEDFQYAIAHQDGLYAYTYSPNYLNLIRAGVVYQDVCYDLDRGTIIGASGSNLEEVSSIGQLINSVTHSSPIKSFDIHYTR